jgi:hypothetical protein
MYNPRQTPGMEGAHHNHQSPMQAPARAYTPAEQHQRNRSGSHNGIPLSPNHYRSHPASPSTSRPPRPVSPSGRDRPASSYYDPISEGRSMARDVNSTPYQPRSPIHVSRGPRAPEQSETDAAIQSRTPYEQQSSNFTNGNHHDQQTPIAHGHPLPGSDARSPKGAYDPARPNGMQSHAPSRRHLICASKSTHSSDHICTQAVTSSASKSQIKRPNENQRRIASSSASFAQVITHRA